jgi:hypothetical protein
MMWIWQHGKMTDDYKIILNCVRKLGEISCQFLLQGGSIGPGYVLKLLFREKSPNC